MGKCPSKYCKKQPQKRPNLFLNPRVLFTSNQKHLPESRKTSGNIKTNDEQARKGFRPPSAMMGIGYFQNLRNLLRNFLDFILGIFWEFFRRIFWRNLLGGIFWRNFLGGFYLGGFFREDFFGRIFWEDLLGGFFGRNFGRNFLGGFVRRNNFWRINFVRNFLGGILCLHC